MHEGDGKRDKSFVSRFYLVFVSSLRDLLGMIMVVHRLEIPASGVRKNI